MSEYAKQSNYHPLPISMRTLRHLTGSRLPEYCCENMPATPTRNIDGGLSPLPHFRIYAVNSSSNGNSHILAIPTAFHFTKRAGTSLSYKIDRTHNTVSSTDSTSASDSLNSELLRRIHEVSGVQLHLFVTKEVVNWRSVTHYNDYHLPGHWDEHAMH